MVKGEKGEGTTISEFSKLWNTTLRKIYQIFLQIPKKPKYNQNSKIQHGIMYPHDFQVLIH